VLLADEPTGALDSENGEQIMQLFRELNNEGVTVIMITHERAIAENADRILYIKDGRISDTPEGGRENE
jgi:putative ABC transport system ATP-binding protein